MTIEANWAEGKQIDAGSKEFLCWTSKYENENMMKLYVIKNAQHGLVKTFCRK